MLSALPRRSIARRIFRKIAPRDGWHPAGPSLPAQNRAMGLNMV